MNLSFELNYSFRNIRKKIAFSTLCAAIIALGFSISIPLYSLVRNFAYAALPFPDGERIVVVKELNPTTDQFDAYQFNAIRENSSTLEVFSLDQELAVTISDGDYAQLYSGSRMSSETLALTGVQPALGRLFSAEDDLPDAEPVVLIDDYVWKNYYNGREDIIGTISRINGEARTIIGVMPPGFGYPQNSEIWLPLAMPELPVPEQALMGGLIGRLAPGVTRDEAAAEVEQILARVAADYPEVYEAHPIEILPLIHRGINGGFPLLNTLAGLASLIFILVCLNVANLLLIRADERIQELAIRTAVGASGRSLTLHVLFESLLVCIVGGAVGLVSAGIVLNIVDSTFASVIPGGRGLPFWFDFGYTPALTLISVALLFSLWVISGVFTSWRVTHRDVVSGLGGNTRGDALPDSGKLNRLLVQSQVVLSFFLLCLSGVLFLEARSLYAVNQLDKPEQYYSAIVNMSGLEPRDEQLEDQFRQELTQQLTSFPDVNSATYTSTLPGTGGRSFGISMVGDELSPDSESPTVGVISVAQNYFEMLDVHLLIEGRLFDSSDTTDSMQVAVVDERFIDQLQLDGSPIGQQLVLDNTESRQQATIIGVVRSAITEGTAVGDGRSSTVYRPITQTSPSQFNLILSTNDSGISTIAELEQRVQRASAQVHQDIPIYFFNTLDISIDRLNFMIRIFVNMVTYAAFGALVLALSGIYGLVSRSVMTRVNEIGIRRAIGSSDTSIVSIFIKQGLRFLMIGLLIGGGAATLVINPVQSAFPTFGIFSSFVISVAVVTTVICMLICYACFVPVRKIVRMEPGEALHYE